MTRFAACCLLAALSMPAPAQDTFGGVTRLACEAMLCLPAAQQLGECLNASWFLNLEDARSKCEAWRTDYNEVRPHSSLGQKAPLERLSQWEQVMTTK